MDCKAVLECMEKVKKYQPVSECQVQKAQYGLNLTVRCGDMILCTPRVVDIDLNVLLPGVLSPCFPLLMPTLVDVCRL